MNYRHAFHAGNFADIVKHAALLQVMMGLRGQALRVIDTHAGRGVYDLGGLEARKSGEAAQGIARLMAADDAPAAFGPLIAAVARLNPKGGVARYPGSPLLIAEALGAGDSYLACELRAEEHAALAALLGRQANVRTVCDDGYEVAQAQRPTAGRTLLLIDPPFEKADDYRRCAETVAAVLGRDRAAQALIWLPLKDLETFDAFLRELEDSTDAPLLVAETRLRPLSDPMKMNGCALVLAGADPALQAPLDAICGWTARTLGEGGQARVRAL